MCVDCTNSINDTPQGMAGEDGADGASAYVYIAYASDNAGTDFSTTDPDLCWKGIISTTSPITSLDASYFVGKWFKTCGNAGTNGRYADSTDLVSTVGLVDTYQILDSDSVAIGTFTVTNGADGDDGISPTITVDSTVTTLTAGSSASVDVTVVGDNTDIHFNIPRGATGAPGQKGDPGLDGDNARMTVQETDTDPSGSDIYILEVTNTDLPNILDINTNTATLDFNIPYSNLASTEAGSHKIYYPQTSGITVGTNYLNATSPHDSIETCWYANIGNANSEEARRIKIKRYNDGATSIIGLIQKKMKSSITTYNMQLNTDTLQTTQIFFTDHVLFDYTFTALEPTINLCQIFPVTIFIHNDSEFDNATDAGHTTNIFGIYQGTASLCGTLLQITGYENISGLDSGTQYYMSININHTFGNPKLGSTTYL